jgi:hypothetical protein
MPPPRTGSAFVLTEFAEAHTPTLHPVWTTGGLPNTLTPTPVSPVSPPQAPPTPAFATWSAGQAVTTVVSVTPSGEVSVAQSGSQQEQPLPSPPSSRPPPSVSSRETQTTETATPVEVMSWLSAPRSTAAPRSTSASGSTWASPSASASAYASTASAQSRRLGIPAEWMRQAEVQAEAQANRTQPAGQVEGRMGGSVPTRSSTK